MEEEEEIIEEKRKPMTISMEPALKRELLKVKKREKYITASGLIEFCILYPYSFGDIIFTLEVLKSSPERRKKFTRYFYSKDFDRLAKIIKETLKRKREIEFKHKDAVRYIRNKEVYGGDGVVEKIIQEIEDKISDLKVKIKMRKN